MKFLLYLAYFFRSVSLRGFANTLRLISAELRFEKKFGIKTAAIKKSGSNAFFHYQGAGYRVLLQLFERMPEHTKNFNFTDIGCGKGRALFVAEYCGYKQLTGIELDNELLMEARQNAERYTLKNKEATIRFAHVNALNYHYHNQPAVYFLFNPFNQEVLQNVLTKIRASTHSETWFIYMNPLFKQAFEANNAELVMEVKTRRYLEAVIYKWKAQPL